MRWLAEFTYSTQACTGSTHINSLRFLERKNPIKKPGPAHSPIENNILNRCKLLEIADSAVSFRMGQDMNSVEIHAAVPRENRSNGSYGTFLPP